MSSENAVDRRNAVCSASADRTISSSPLRHAPSGDVTMSAEDTWRWGDVRETDITPSWIGGDGIFTEGVDGEGRDVLRRRFPVSELPYASDVDSVTTLMRAAADRGIAPDVIESGPDYVIMRRMPDSWRSAKLDELRNPYLLWAVLEQRRRIHDIPLSQLPGVAHRSMLDQMAQMRDRCIADGVPLPRLVDRVLESLGPFLRRADEFREMAVPCHGDGAASNVLVDTAPDSGSAARPMLTGWTVCGIMDPIEDAGSVLAEVGPFCGVPASLISGMGLPSDALPVAQAYGIVNDVYWGIIGLWRSATSQDPTIDFAKYGLWRLQKAANQLVLPIGPASWLASL